MTVDQVDYEALDTLMDRLDLEAQSLAGQPARKSRIQDRRHARHPFRLGCTVYFYRPGSYSIASIPGRTRNLSRSGMGLIARRMFNVGEPIELEIQVPNRPTTYMAGVVAFCRYAGHGYHEIGILMYKAGANPIFSQSPSEALHLYDWLRESKLKSS